MAKKSAPSFPNIIRPFQIEGSDVRGRLVRIGSAFDKVLEQHNYPAPVARLIGETLALAAALASTVKYAGVFNLQAQGSGPVNLLVADVDSEGGLRGFARYEEAPFEAGAEIEQSIPKLMGTGPSPSIKAPTPTAIRASRPSKALLFRNAPSSIFATPSSWRRRSCWLRIWMRIGIPKPRPGAPERFCCNGSPIRRALTAPRKTGKRNGATPLS